MYGTSVVIDLTFPLLGYLKFDTLLYVWDQYILGLNVPGFSAEWLAVVIATVLGLEHDKLKECQSVGLLYVHLSQNIWLQSLAQIYNFKLITVVML